MQMSWRYIVYLSISFFLSPSSMLAYIFCENMTDSGDWMIVISMVGEKRDYRIYRRTIFPFFESLWNTRRAPKKVHSRELTNLNGLIYWMRINFEVEWRSGRTRRERIRVTFSLKDRFLNESDDPLRSTLEPQMPYRGIFLSTSQTHTYNAYAFAKYIGRWMFMAECEYSIR